MLALMLLLAAPAFAGPRVVMLGDSLVAGFGLAEADGVVPQLQAWLDARGAAAELVNAGVSGDTSAGGKARLDWALAEGADALVVELGGNDMLRGLPPALTRSNLDAIVETARARGLPVLIAGMQAPGNFGPDYKAAFDRIYPDLAQKHGALLYPAFLGALTEDGLEAARALMQPDGIHPNKEGVARIVEDLGPLMLVLIAATR